MLYLYLALHWNVHVLLTGPFLNVMLQRMQQAQKVKKVYEAHDETMKFYIYSSVGHILTEPLTKSYACLINQH